ncbi:hypothetical protein BC827DRAFT_613645 [Russula dissimulans]|nr:hypothetical protein BC827DRAFT_613645 [Russula dissimulans]
MRRWACVHASALLACLFLGDLTRATRRSRVIIFTVCLSVFRRCMITLQDCEGMYTRTDSNKIMWCRLVRLWYYRHSVYAVEMECRSSLAMGPLCDSALASKVFFISSPSIRRSRLQIPRRVCEEIIAEDPQARAAPKRNAPCPASIGYGRRSITTETSPSQVRSRS